MSGKKLTQEEFIAKGKIATDNKFSYEKTVYKNTRSNVILTCPIHGDFEQKACSHLMGKGCDKCGGTSKLTTEEWVARAISTRGGFYDYSEVEYVSNKKKIAIICPQHGKFYQTPDNHMGGQDCPNCASSGFKTSNAASLYVLGFGHDITKVGITNRSANYRAKQIAKSSGINFEVLLEIRFASGRIALDVETQIKRYLKSNYKNIDKFFDGYTETFVDVDRTSLYLKITEKCGECFSANNY